MLLTGDTECHLGTSVVVMTRGDPGIEWVGARNAVQHPTVPKTTPKAAEPMEGPRFIGVDNHGPTVPSSAHIRMAPVRDTYIGMSCAAFS